MDRKGAVECSRADIHVWGTGDPDDWLGKHSLEDAWEVVADRFDRDDGSGAVADAASSASKSLAGPGPISRSRPPAVA